MENHWLSKAAGLLMLPKGKVHFGVKWRQGQRWRRAPHAMAYLRCFLGFERPHEFPLRRDAVEQLQGRGTCLTVAHVRHLPAQSLR